VYRNVTHKSEATIRIKWVRSGIQEAVVRGLGLRRLNHVVERQDTPQIRGMVAKVPHMVEIVSESADPPRELPPEYTVRHVVIAPVVVEAQAPVAKEVTTAGVSETETEAVVASKPKAAPAAKAKAQRVAKKAKAATKAAPTEKAKTKPKKAEPKAGKPSKSGKK
jgi:large subunit ribosomal protein L30